MFSHLCLADKEGSASPDEKRYRNYRIIDSAFSRTEANYDEVWEVNPDRESRKRKLPSITIWADYFRGEVKQ